MNRFWHYKGKRNRFINQSLPEKRLAIVRDQGNSTIISVANYYLFRQRGRTRRTSGSYSHRDDVSSILSIESYGSNNSNWVTERSMATTYTR